MKKTLSLLLSVLMIITTLSALPFSANAKTTLNYTSVYVTGNGSNDQSGNWLNGVDWNPGHWSNRMTKLSDDVWQITFENVPAGNDYTCKFTVDGSWSTNFGGNGTRAQNGVQYDAVYNSSNNIVFNLTQASDVTLKLDLSNYDPSTHEGAKYWVNPYPESSHPYEFGADQSWVWTYSGEASSLDITFSDDTETEANYDKIYIYDSTDELVGEFSGTELKNQTVTVPGNSFKIRLKTDGSRSEYGFRIVNIEPTAVKYNLYIAGTQVTSANASDVFGDGKVSFDAETTTLTLNNYTFEGKGYTHSNNEYNDYFAALCYNPDYKDVAPLNIVLIGNNTIKETGSGSYTGSKITVSYGMEIHAPMTITGSGTLNVESGITTGSSCGIYQDDELTLPAEFTGTLNVKSGYSGAYTTGMYSYLTIYSGTVNATGGNSGYTSYGFSGGLVMHGGVVNAQGGDITTAVEGCYSEGMGCDIWMDGGTVNARSGKATGFDGYSYGACCSNVNMTGGSITAFGDEASTASYGLAASDVTITNAVLSATASESGTTSIGLFAGGHIYFEIDKCTVEAKTLATTATTARALRYMPYSMNNVTATASIKSDGSNPIVVDKSNYDTYENYTTYKWFKTEPAHVHTTEYHKAVEATTDKAGNTAYYECTVCHKYFSDAAATNEITDKASVVIPKVKVDTKLNVDSTSIYTVCSIKNKTLTVNWKKVKNATNYEIEYRKAGASKWTSRSTSGKNSFVIKGLAANGLYEFRVCTVMIKGKQQTISPWSNVNRRYIYQAKQTKLTGGKGSVTPVWNKDKNATSYEIQIATDKNFTKNVKKVTAKKSATKKTVKGLKKGKKYYVRIRSVKKYKNANYTGQWSNAKNVKVK